MAAVILFMCIFTSITFVKGSYLESTNTSSEFTEVDFHGLHRDGRLFFIFPLFPPFRRRPCYTASQRGVCLTARQCAAAAGTTSGQCASGRGVCCIFQKTCGESSDANFTYFTNTGYPNAFSAGQRCTLTISTINPNICNLRINLKEMSLAQPSADGACNNDFLSTSSGTPNLCGDSSGQHFYVDFNPTLSPFSISIDTNSAVSYSRLWNIELIQVPCSSAVPAGCLQYFNTTSGSVNSFNYAATNPPTTTTTGETGNRQLMGLSYGICVKPVAGYCTIEWSRSSTSLFTFTISDDTNVLDPTTVLGTADAALQGADCTTNFIIIPNPTQYGQPVLTDRFCGNGFVPTVSLSRPFNLFVVTDAQSILPSPNIGNRGFSLNFRQIPC